MLIILLLFTIFVQQNLAFPLFLSKHKWLSMIFADWIYIFSHFGYIHTDRSHYTRIQRTIFTNSEVFHEKSSCYP